MTHSDQRRAVRDFFSSDADAYDTRHYGSRYRTFFADRQNLIAQVLRDLSLPAGVRVLDIACGPGHFLQEAASAGAVAVGIDSSRDMLRTAGTRLGVRARLVRGNGMALPFESRSFDIVNCSGLIEYIPEPMPLLQEVFRVLKTGGRALVSSTNRLSPALILDPLVDAAKRSALIRGAVRAIGLPIDPMSLRDRRFRMTFHTPRRLAAQLREAGFESVRMEYYHLQLLPHPLDRISPAAAAACVKLTDRFLSVGPLRALAEGLLAIAQRPISSATRST